MEDDSLTRRSLVRALSASPVAVTAGCLGFGPSVDLEYCNERLERPCEGTDVQKDVLGFENVVTSEETYGAGTPFEAAAVVVESPDRLVIHGWATGNGDPECRTFRVIQADRSAREFRFAVESSTTPFEGCIQTRAAVYYRAEVAVDTEQLDEVQITHVAGGSTSPEEIVLRDTVDFSKTGQ